MSLFLKSLKALLHGPLAFCDEKFHANVIFVPFLADSFFFSVVFYDCVFMFDVMKCHSSILDI